MDSSDSDRSESDVIHSDSTDNLPVKKNVFLYMTKKFTFKSKLFRHIKTQYLPVFAT
mgnify:CR=1 FL=1